MRGDVVEVGDVVETPAPAGSGAPAESVIPESGDSAAASLSVEPQPEVNEDEVVREALKALSGQ
jgi:hypothetical protein